VIVLIKQKENEKRKRTLLDRLEVTKESKRNKKLYLIRSDSLLLKEKGWG